MAARYDRTIVTWKGVLKNILAVFMWWNLGLPATAPVIFTGLLRLKKRSTEKKTPWERLPQGDRSRQIRKFTHTQIQILARFYSITWCFTTKKIGISREKFIAFLSVEFPMICWIIKHICALLVLVDKKNSEDPFFFTKCENFKRFHQSKLKKITGKAKLLLAGASFLGALAQ